MFYVNEKQLILDIIKMTAMNGFHYQNINHIHECPRLKESMMGLRPRQGNLGQVFRLLKSDPRLDHEVYISIS